MKRFAVLALAPALFLTASLAEDARPYDNGPVWDFSMIQTKGGHFDDYMKFVSTQWKAQQEAAKAKGAVLDYKVFAVTDARDNEPDIILAVEYKNMGVFDAPLDEQEAIQKKVFGSMSAANKLSVDRESIRTLKGDVLTRELILK